jgi:hypothetical protein
LRLRGPAYGTESLVRWRDSLGSFERAFVFFKHEDEALGPKLAGRMQALAEN